jgi:hypothetical protein
VQGLTQFDSTAYRLYKDEVTVYSMTGYNATNFALSPQFGSFKRQRFVLNPPLLLGFGAAYKGVDLLLSFRTPYLLYPASDYGKSDYFDFKLKVPYKKIQWALRIQQYHGFSLVSGQEEWTSVPIIYPDLTTFSINLDARYFFREAFNYSAALGFSGEYLSDFLTPYIYAYSGGSRLKNREGTLLPETLHDPAFSISLMDRLGCVELGASPGLAGVKRHQAWQGLMLLGFGPLMQVKWYETPQNQRGFFGLSSRTDLLLSVGYHKSRWFLQVMTEFQFRRINFNQIKTQQYYYDFRIYAGYLIGVKKHPKFVVKLEEMGIL